MPFSRFIFQENFSISNCFLYKKFQHISVLLLNFSPWGPIGLIGPIVFIPAYYSKTLLLQVRQAYKAFFCCTAWNKKRKDQLLIRTNTRSTRMFSNASRMSNKNKVGSPTTKAQTHNFPIFYLEFFLRSYGPVISSPTNLFLLFQQITFNILIWNSKINWGSPTFFAHFIDMRRRMRVSRGTCLLNANENVFAFRVFQRAVLWGTRYVINYILLFTKNKFTKLPFIKTKMMSLWNMRRHNIYTLPNVKFFPKLKFPKI